MAAANTFNYPKLHNAMWPGLVGKGSPGAEPSIDLDTMLDLTAAAEVDGVKFDGVDIFLYDPHINIDISDEDLKAVAAKIAAKGFVVGSVVAPVWFDGSAMGDERQRGNFLTGRPQGVPDRQEAARAGRSSLRNRPHRLGRIARRLGQGPRRQSEEDRRDLQAGRRRSPAITASGWPPRARSAGAACTPGGTMVDLLERVGEPETVGFQADMAHTLLYTLGENAPEDRILPKDFDWKDRATLDAALKTLTAALRPWTIDFHVAQNDATVFGSGTHDHTGRHCLADDPRRQARHPPSRRLLAPRRERQAHQEAPPHLLGRLHVPQRRHDEARDLERHPARP